MESPDPSLFSSASRRSLLQTGSLAAASGLFPAALFGDEDRFRTVSIFATTDLHGHVLPTHTYSGLGPVGGLGRCISQIRNWKNENPHHLLIDAGDVYQGTEVSQASDGKLMIDLLNRLGYDAWVIGNHEFDWGSDILLEAIAGSDMPVLSSNLRYGGKPAGKHGDPSHPFARVVPSILKAVGGMKIGLVGLTTPGLPYWLPDALLGGFTVRDPVLPVKRAVTRLRAAGADAVIAVGHMGLKSGHDDFANRVLSVVGEVDGIDAFVGGHTHRDLPSKWLDGVSGKVLYVQSGYYGIHCGRLDLTFDLETRKLVDRRAHATFMDDRFDPDPLVLQVAGEALAESEGRLEARVGETTEIFSSRGENGSPSPLHQLLGAAIRQGLKKRGVSVDGVLHGIFLEGDLPAGEKTLADVWKLVPYDNSLVVAGLLPSEIRTVLKESASARYNRTVLMALVAEVAGDGIRLFDENAEPLQEDRRYRIALNSYDAQSAGRHYLRLRDLVRSKQAASKHHALQTRDLVTDLFADQKSISTATLATLLKSAP